ncbi:unnamed protein product, partial [Allacma fusca]
MPNKGKNDPQERHPNTLQARTNTRSAGPVAENEETLDELNARIRRERREERRRDRENRSNTHDSELSTLPSENSSSFSQSVIVGENTDTRPRGHNGNEESIHPEATSSTHDDLTDCDQVIMEEIHSAENAKEEGDSEEEVLGEFMKNAAGE